MDVPVFLLRSGVAFALLAVSSPAAAQVKSFTVEVDGLSCPFSAFSLERRLTTLPGVAAVRFDFRRSSVTLNLAEDVSIAPDLVTDAVGELDMRVRSLMLEGRGSIRGRGEDLRIALGNRLVVWIGQGEARAQLNALVAQGKRDFQVAGSLTRVQDRLVLAVTQVSEIREE